MACSSSSSPLTIRVMPSWISTTGKLISKPSRLSAEPEIGQKLFLVDRSKRLDGFDFHDDLVFDDPIGPESGVDAHVLIDYRKRLLAHRAETAPAQFIRPDCIVYGFQPARAERRMNAIGGVDDFLGNGSRSYQPSLVSR